MLKSGGGGRAGEGGQLHEAGATRGVEKVTHRRNEIERGGGWATTRSRRNEINREAWRKPPWTQRVHVILINYKSFSQLCLVFLLLCYSRIP